MTNNPLDESHYQKCQQVLQRCRDGIELADACIACGWPADELKATLQAQQKQAEAVKSQFFPDRL